MARIDSGASPHLAAVLSPGKLKPPTKVTGGSALRRIIDLSVPIENGVPSDPPGLEAKIEYRTHKETEAEAAAFYPGFDTGDFPDNAGFAAVERVTLTTHNGTHMDAPWHYHPTMDGGKPSMRIDEVPLDWCYQRGVKLDFRHFEDGHRVMAADVDSELRRIGHELQPLDIVLVNTRAAAAFGTPEYIHSGCGMSAEATLFLTSRGVRVTGIDAWSWDPPLKHVAAAFARTGDTSLVWEGHKAGRHTCYCHLEKLYNLEALPSRGFDVICFPTKVHAASGGWTRAVAVLHD